MTTGIAAALAVSLGFDAGEHDPVATFKITIGGYAEAARRLAALRLPTLLVQGEWDQDLPPYMAQTLFPLLVNSPGKRYVMLAEGTHTIIMEKNRLELFKAVQAFLDEGGGS